MNKIDETVGGNTYLFESLLGRGDVSMGDVLLYRIVERMLVLKPGPMADVFEGQDWPNLKRWFDHMSTFPWIRDARQPPHRFLNLVVRKLAGEEGQLPPKLDLEFYDERPYATHPELSLD